jgi:hypothetical protein
MVGEAGPCGPGRKVCTEIYAFHSTSFTTFVLTPAVPEKSRIHEELHLTSLRMRDSNFPFTVVALLSFRSLILFPSHYMS